MPAVDRRLIRNFEWPLFGLVVGLVLIGVINLISASPESTGLLPSISKRQLSWLGIGLIGMVGTMIPDYRTFQRLAIPIYVVGVVSLVAVASTAATVSSSSASGASSGNGVDNPITSDSDVTRSDSKSASASARRRRSSICCLS